MDQASPNLRIHACLAFVLLGLACGSVGAAEPHGLPRYTLDIDLDVANHLCRVHQRMEWTNRHSCPAAELVFNAHSHFKLPEKDVGMTAKIFEILRLTPEEAVDNEGHSLDVRKMHLVGPGGEGKQAGDLCELAFHYRDDNDSALVVALPRPVQPGETVTIDIEFLLHLPHKFGRWGQWDGITYLTNWLPVLAYHDEAGWHPTPYVAWHQPFFNEAGIFTVCLTVAGDQKVACTASVQAELDLGDGRKRIDFAPTLARDFAILCSARYQEYTGQSGTIRVRCLATPKHEPYARFMVDSAVEALATYTRWFGPYPYPEFTIAESYFGWHSNECAGLILIDSRIFDMPHLARAFVDYLVAQATCHQWWYNVVGTNGYSETWMDEGLATYFAYHLMRSKYGHNDPLVHYPKGLRWLPNVYRNDYRYFNLYGTLGRGDKMPTVQDIPQYGHIVDLYSMCYERGSKVVGMIEHALGEEAFFDFMRFVYRRHAWGILRVAEFQRDLEEFTHQSWHSFFEKWVYGAGVSDWCVEDVRIEPLPSSPDAPARVLPPPPPLQGRKRVRDWFRAREPCKVTVVVHQKADNNDPTVLGFCLDGGEGFQVRVPVVPDAGFIEINDPPGRMETLEGNRVRVEVELPCPPTQVAVDPDEVLVDRDPANNYWRPLCRLRFSALYTFLDETDLTNAYDRWNGIVGPWLFAPTYDNPWFTRSTRFGARAGAYRTQQFDGGAYIAYRTDYRDIVEGVDFVLDHWPWNHTEVGFVAERRLAGSLRGEDQANRGVLYGRYVIDYGDSLYLPPFQYVEAFTTIQDDLLPDARETVPGATRFQHQGMAGIHYHINYLTPYWDPVGGFSFDVSYAGGLEVPGEHLDIDGAHQFIAQGTYVLDAPDGLGWLSETKLAFRAYGAFGLPINVQWFALGGGELFRGYDLAQRQGNALWVGSTERRVPIVKHLRWGCLDHALTVENIYAAAFCDVGNVYLNGRTVGGTAEAVGLGLRLDVAWFTFVERTILRFDFARTINSDQPMQFWAGLEHPF